MRCSPRSVFKPSALLSVRLVRMPTPSAACLPFARTASTISSSSHGDSSNRSSMSTSANCNQGRPHRGLQLAPPIPRSLPCPPINKATITRRDILGAIIHEYERAA